MAGAGQEWGTCGAETGISRGGRETDPSSRPGFQKLRGGWEEDQPGMPGLAFNSGSVFRLLWSLGRLDALSGLHSPLLKMRGRFPRSAHSGDSYTQTTAHMAGDGTGRWEGERCVCFPGLSTEICGQNILWPNGRPLTWTRRQKQRWEGTLGFVY